MGSEPRQSYYHSHFTDEKAEVLSTVEPTLLNGVTAG